MQPWFIATRTFGPEKGEAWRMYIEWSGLKQLDELVSLDAILCPSVLTEIKPTSPFFFAKRRAPQTKTFCASSAIRSGIRRELCVRHPEEDHANCHVWSVERAVGL